MAKQVLNQGNLTSEFMVLITAKCCLIELLEVLDKYEWTQIDINICRENKTNAFIIG